MASKEADRNLEEARHQEAGDQNLGGVQLALEEPCLVADPVRPAVAQTRPAEAPPLEALERVAGDLPGAGQNHQPAGVPPEAGRNPRVAEHPAGAQGHQAAAAYCTPYRQHWLAHWGRRNGDSSSHNLHIRPARPVRASDPQHTVLGAQWIKN